MPAQTRVIHYYVCLGAAGGKECVVTMDINNVYVIDAILYYTIKQYFNCNDKRTCQFIAQLDHFNYRSGLLYNIPYLSSQLCISEKDFYNTYLRSQR